MLQVAHERARQKLTEEIRKLPPDEQADLMENCSSSLTASPIPKVTKPGRSEIDRRVDAVERGEAKPIDARKRLAQYKKL